MLEQTLAQTKPTNWRTANHPANPDEAWFTFETAAGRAVGHLRLREGRAYTLLSALRSLHAHPERPGQREPDLGVTRQPDVLIVGGGQGGIALAARLKRLGVPAVVVEKNARAGDSWRKRYASLCCTTRCGTTTCRTSRFPRAGRCSRRRTGWATGSRRT